CALRVQVAQVIVALPAAALTDFLPYTPLCPKKPYSRGSQALYQSHSESYEPTSRVQVMQALRVIRLTWAPRYISIAALEYAYQGWILRALSFVFWRLREVFNEALGIFVHSFLSGTQASQPHRSLGGMRIEGECWFRWSRDHVT